MILVSTAPRRHDRSILPLFRRQRKWLRVSVRIGELVRELETADHGGASGGTKVQPDAPSKERAIADAGLNKRTAFSYQELAGPRDQQAQAAPKRNGRSRSPLPSLLKAAYSNGQVCEGIAGAAV
jgi:hypothetical protein